MPKHRRYARGFSLLEVLVAFVILALVLGTLMEIFSTGLRNISSGGEYQRAVLLAQSKLAAVGVELPLVEGDSEGEFDSSYRWRISIKRYQPLQIEPAPADGAPGLVAVLPVTLLEVEIRVLWGAGDQPHGVNLNTVRLANRAQL